MPYVNVKENISDGCRAIKQLDYFSIVNQPEKPAGRSL